MKVMIKAQLYAIFFFYILSNSCSGQSLTRKSYTDFFVKEDKIYALTTNGRLDILYTNGISFATNLNAGDPIVAIGNDNHGKVIVGTKNGSVLKLETNSNSFRALISGCNEIYGILFDSYNDGYCISKKGITLIKNKQSYLPDSTFKTNIEIPVWSQPSAIFMDKNDCIWFGYGRGEWRGQLYIFNTRAKKFVKPIFCGKSYLNPVTSIFSNGESIFVSGGCDHMMTYGNLLKFKGRRAKTFFLSETKRVKDTGVDSVDIAWGENIRFAIFNNADSFFYFYSQNGLFRGNPTNNLSKFENWVNVARPKSKRPYAQPNKGDMPVNVVKMEGGPGGKIYMLTEDDGIGVYDGASFKLLDQLD